MAISWLSLLQLVPEVVRTAPQVAEGARKLWRTVAGRAVATPAPQPAPVDEQMQNQLQAEAHAIAQLRSELQATGAAVSELQAQMLAATELINDLADQNAQLVQIAQAQRRQLALLTWMTAALVVVAVAALVYLGRS